MEISSYGEIHARRLFRAHVRVFTPSMAKSNGATEYKQSTRSTPTTYKQEKLAQAIFCDCNAWCTNLSSSEISRPKPNDCEPSDKGRDRDL